LVKKKELIVLLAVFMLLTIMAISLAVPLSVNAEKSVKPKTMPWLNTSGTELYDSKGNPIHLYACNILADSTWTNRAIINETDISKIKSYGFDAIRIHLEWSFLQPINSSSVDESMFMTSTRGNLGASIDDIVQWSTYNGIYVIFNLHWGSSFNAPDWVPTANKNVGCTTGDGGRAVDIFGDANVRSGIAYLYNFMAKRYASNSSVIFEGINELLCPNDSDAGRPFADFNNQWISAIENGEGKNSHIKIVEVLIDQSWEVLFNAPYVNGTHANIMLATHDYSPYKGWTGTQAQIDTLISRLTSQANLVHAANYPIINTEFSKSQDQKAYLSFFNTELTGFAKNDYQGWAYWCYCADSMINTSGQTVWNLNDPTIQTNILPTLQSYMIQTS
jgi:hypothetical protein